ncbi:MAG: DUF4388 domain-containing protein [Verrucomicrobiota bacterium]
MCCLSKRSGQITFRSGESYGFIYIQHGRVLHALCGNTEGEEAIYSMLTWPGGGFSLDEGILPHKKTVTSTWEQLLFEAARRADLGTNRPKPLGPTVTTAEPMTIRMYDSQPKLTVTRPDLPEATHLLEKEYTHVGRAAGNEIALPYPSVSNRHCIFIHSGPDIVLRDLNSSNGTYVNGELASEVILRPGRPDPDRRGLHEVRAGRQAAEADPDREPRHGRADRPAQVPGRHQLAPVPDLPPAQRTGAPRAEGQTKDDSVYVKGESAISYDDLAGRTPRRRAGSGSSSPRL